MLKTASTYTLGLLFLTACGDASSTSNNGQNTQDSADADTVAAKVEIPKPQDRQFDDIARFIAGLPSREGSPYAKFEEESVWKNYAQTMDGRWSSITTQKLPKIEKWRDEELKDINTGGGTLFYPFSGPDFLHAITFFPKMDTIVMVGLEPIGSVPNPDNITKKSLAGYFGGLQQSLSTILSYSFFRTLAMENDFTGRVVSDIDGTLPVLMLFMVRTNHKILHYEKVVLTDEGKAITADSTALKDKGKYIATKVAFCHQDRPDEYRIVYYFSANLQNTAYGARPGIDERADFKGFLSSLNPRATYLKSASYLMYRDSFSSIRNLILDNSRYLLQDDSGMPINTINRERWKLIFYGNYVAPIPLFRERYQADLRKIYIDKEANGVRNLPFGIGYQYQEGTSNLMLGVRQ
ncbi:hypothetical protein [Eisenibacter elegans]|uniref:hypothetical protein n=1 Tax=Eisenibacter elegans TaxID=997 RepID=UPI0012B575FF|nr:hypothetical protein [Eisenibacter elegans]